MSLMEGPSSFPMLSVCIPAFNRPVELSQLLASIASQGRGPWDVVICEDHSPGGDEISEVVNSFCRNNPELPVHFFRNETNLGYDGNLRQLLSKADGKYCLFMGDDDLFMPGALRSVVNVLDRPNIGFVLRAWKSVDASTGRDIEEYRYFAKDRLFLPGKESIAALFRRSVFISGLIVHRMKAKTFDTSRFDGTLLYQLYLVGRTLTTMNAYYVSDIITLRRVGGEHYFGSSETEKGVFTPRQLLPVHSLAFIRGLLHIARVLDHEHSPGVFRLIRQDLVRYSYPILEIQSRNLNTIEFRDYANQLVDLGFGKNIIFWIYYYLLRLLGPSISNTLIRWAKRSLGHTPNLSGTTGIVISK
jgi:abequosyltransferase